MLGAHHIISATVCFAGDNRNFRHCSLTISIKQFCPVTNNSAIFLIDSRKESRHIYQCQQGDIESIAEADKTGSFDRCVNIQRACKYQWLISHHSHCFSIQPDIAGHNIRCIFCLKFEETIIISHCFNYFFYIIRLIRISWNQISQFRSQAGRRIVCSYKRRLFHIISRQIGNQFTNIINTLNIILRRKMSYTGLCHVYAYSAEFLFSDFFLCHTSHHIRSCNKHITGIFHHQDKICQCRRINRTSGTWAHDRTNLRNHSGCHRVAQKYLGISGQRTYPLLNSCTARVVQSDDGCSHLHSHIHHFTNFLSVRFRKSSTKYGEILCKDIN